MASNEKRARGYVVRVLPRWRNSPKDGVRSVVTGEEVVIGVSAVAADVVSFVVWVKFTFRISCADPQKATPVRKHLVQHCAPSVRTELHNA